MGRPNLATALIAAIVLAAAIPLAPRAQDVFSTTTGGGAPLQGGVSVTQPAEPGHTRPTGTQGVDGNPDCPPPVMADGTSPKNWSCTTGNQGVVSNPDCPAPVNADGTSPKNWSCTTGTQGVEGNPNCPPPVIQGGMIPRNWSCAGPDMRPDPLSPLRDPAIPVDYRGDPGVPPLMRANASTDEEAAASAVLTCRRAVVEGIERPSQAEMAEYVCDDQGKALDLPPFRLQVEQTVCILPLKGAVEELKAGKMLLMKAKDASGAERDWHMTKGNTHLLRASISVDQSDLCLVENPPQPRAARQRPPAPPVDLRAAAKDPCRPVAGLDPRLRGALDAKCPKAPSKDAPQPRPQAQPQPQPRPQPGPQQAQQPQTDDPDGGCVVAQAPLDVRDWLMDLAHRLDRNADALQAPAMKGANRFFTGMNEVLQQLLRSLAQEPGKPASQFADAMVKHLTNNALENHNKLLADAQKAVEDFVKDPTYESGKMVSNYLIGRVSGAATGAVVDRLPGGPKFCLAASHRATEESRKIRDAIKAGEELDKLAKQAEGAADAPKFCRINPDAAARDAHMRAEMAKRQQDKAWQDAELLKRQKARPQRKQAGERQIAGQVQRDKMQRERVAQRDQKSARQGGEQDKQQTAAYQKALDDQRAQQAQAIRESNSRVDAQKLADQKRMKAEAPRRPSPPSPGEAAQQRQTKQAERQHAIEEAQRLNAPRRAEAGQPKQGNLSPEQQRRAEEWEMAQQARQEQKARAERRAAAGGDVPRQPSNPGDTVRMRPEGGDPAQQGGYGGGGGQGPGVGDPKPLTDQQSRVNPFAEETNCVSANVAGDLRKKNPGMPYTADDIRPSWSATPTPPVEVMEILKKHYGDLRFSDHSPSRTRAQALGIPTKVTSSNDIRQELLHKHAAADSRGVVFAYDKVNRKGHVVRAERDGAQVKYIDEQKNTDGTMWVVGPDWTPGDFDVFFYRTN
jgi:hypothetical protein